MPKILFRADADKRAGTGDLLSLLYLSEYFTGWRKYFITKDTLIAKSILRRNKIQKVKYIHRNITIAEEIALLNGFIRKNKIDVAFLEITTRKIRGYEGISASFKACVNFDGVIPDNFDLVVNWDVGSGALYDRRKYFYTSFYLGPQYVFLRKEIFERTKRFKAKTTGLKRVRDVLVFFGGFDKFNFTLKIIKALEGIDADLNLNIIIGAGYKHKKRLMDYLKKSKFSEYKICQNIKNMHKEYLKTDLAVISGGLSVSEAVALKVPVAVIATYEHQIERSRYFEKRGAALYLGFRKCNMFKLKNVIHGYRFNYFKKAFATDAIPRFINEKFGYKT